jgi:hypothetical protein
MKTTPIGSINNIVVNQFSSFLGFCVNSDRLQCSASFAVLLLFGFGFFVALSHLHYAMLCVVTVLCCVLQHCSLFPHLLSANGCVAIIASISSQLAPFTAIFSQTMFFSSHLPKAILCVVTVLCCVLQHCPPLRNMSSWLSWPHSLHFITIGSFYSHFPPVCAVTLVFCVQWFFQQTNDDTWWSSSYRRTFSFAALCILWKVKPKAQGLRTSLRLYQV